MTTYRTALSLSVNVDLDNQLVTLKLVFPDLTSELWFFTGTHVHTMQAQIERASERWLRSFQFDDESNARRKRALDLQPSFVAGDLDARHGARQIRSVVGADEFSNAIRFTLLTHDGAHVTVDLGVEVALILRNYLREATPLLVNLQSYTGPAQ